MAIEWLIACASDEAEPGNRAQRPTGSIEQALFASPAYPSLHGHPAQPAELVEHECIFARHPQRQAPWRLELIPAFTVFKYQSGAPYQSAEFRKKSAAIYRAAGVPR